MQESIHFLSRLNSFPSISSVKLNIYKRFFSHKICLIEWYFLFKNANYSFGQLWSAYSACSIYLKLSHSKNYLKLLDVLTQLSSPMNKLNPYLKTLISGLAALKLLLLPWLFHLTLWTSIHSFRKRTASRSWCRSFKLIVSIGTVRPIRHSGMRWNGSCEPDSLTTRASIFTNLAFHFLILPSYISCAALMFSCVQALVCVHWLCIWMEVRPELKSFAGLRSEVQ